MIHLTIAQLLFIHHRLITETGGSGGLRDMDRLEAAQARPQATFDGLPLYPDLATKAAALMESLVLGHPFVDGNKRVGITAAALFLRLNGQQLNVSNQELEAFALAVARGELDLDAITAWIQANCTPIA